MKTILAFALALFCLAPSAFADEFDIYREAVDKITEWQSEKGLIDYKGTNRTLKAYVNAHNTAVKTIEKENAKIKQANATYSSQTSIIKPNDPRITINKPMFHGGRNAVIAKEKIKRDDAIKRAEMGINSAKRKKIETQKLALQEMRRKLKSLKITDDYKKMDQDKLVNSITELIEGLSIDNE